MGSVYIWLKRIYIVVISLIAIICLLLLGVSLSVLGTIHQQEEVERNTAVILFTYSFVIGIIVLTIFGAFGVLKEKKWALIVFAVGMIMSSLFMLLETVGALIFLRPKLVEDTKKYYGSLLPLANATEVLSEIQTRLECCGIEGYQDWNSSIPESCLCTVESTNPCVVAPRNSSLVNVGEDDPFFMIYEKGCLPYIIEITKYTFRIALGMMLAFLLLWVLSIVLCIIILCQLDRNKANTAVN